jgi:adenylosuccinate synthase
MRCSRVMARSGLRVVDLLHPALLKTHIEAACAEKNAIAHALFGTDPLDPEKMYDEYAAAAEQVRPFVADTGRCSTASWPRAAA